MRSPPTTAQRGYSTMEKFGKKQFKTAFSGPPGPFRLSLFTAPVTHYRMIYSQEKFNLSCFSSPKLHQQLSSSVDFHLSLWYINGVKAFLNPAPVQEEFNGIVSNGIRNLPSGTDWVLFHRFSPLLSEKCHCTGIKGIFFKITAGFKHGNDVSSEEFWVLTKRSHFPSSNRSHQKQEEDTQIICYSQDFGRVYPAMSWMEH